MASASAAEATLEAHRLEQLGLFPAALKAYERALELAPDQLVAATRYHRLKRALLPDTPREIKILWQIDPDAMWESGWVRHLLSGLNGSEIVDGHHVQFHDGCIVIDNRMEPKKSRYYFELLKRGHRFALFHLSDELYRDDCTSYNFANSVLRNYWSPAHADGRRVMAVPLGLMNGFHVQTGKPASERRRVWSFMGNAAKSSRAEMLAAMSAVEGGLFHGTYGTHPHPQLPDLKAPLAIGDYARTMSETIFAPCPSGWENLDSFRVCEAFEAGCIPIVEKRPGFDYFQRLMPGHPALTIERWSEAPQLVRVLMDRPEAAEQKRLECSDWWKRYRNELVERVREHVVRSFTPGAAAEA